MQARRLQFLAAALVLGALLAGFPVAAAPTFDAGTPIGVVNQDNAYDSWTSLDGQLVMIVHTVDTSNVVVVEVSQDGGANWETRSTGITGFAPRIAARDNSHVVIVAGTIASGDGRAGKVIRTTTDAYTWTSATVWTGGTGGIQRLDIDFYSSRYVVAFENCAVTACGFSNSVSNEYQWQWAASTNDGSSWTATATIETYNAAITAAGAGVHVWSGVAVAMQSDTAWEVFYYKTTTDSPDWVIRRAVTSNTGAAHTIVTVNDQFSPLATLNAGYGGDIQVSRDGNSISFKGNTAASPTLYVGQNGAGDLWSFTTVDTAVLGFLSPVFTCASKAVAIYQGTSGDDRLSYSEASGGSQTSTAITGATETVVRPYTAYLRGHDITAVYGDLGNGRTVLKTTTNGDCAQIPSAAGAAATATFTNLLGFDVDVTGQSVLIARTDNGGTVSTYSPGTLAQLGTDPDGACQAAQTWAAADALPTHVAYTECDPADDVDTMKIKSPTMGSPSFNGCTWCRATIDEGDLNIDLPNNMVNIRSVSQYPYTFEEQDDGGVLGVAFTTVAFPFVEYDTGDFGIWAVRFNNNLADSDTTTRVNFAGSGTTITDMCSWRSSLTNRDYIAVAQPTVGLKVFTFEIDASNEGDAHVLDPGDIVISQYQVAPSFLLKAQSIGCWENLIMATTTDFKVGAYYLDSDAETGVEAGQTAWSRSDVVTIPGGITRQLGLVNGTYYGAYADSSDVEVVNAGTGEILDTLPAPASSFTPPLLSGMDMDRNGNYLWVGTDTTLERWDVYSVTTGNETLDNNPNPFQGPGNIASSSSPTSGPAGVVSADDANFFAPAGSPLPPGFTGATYSFFLGLLMMFGVGAGLFFAFKMNAIAGLIGLVMGFLGAFAFGLFDPWLLLVVVVLAVAIIFLKIKGSAAG